MGEGNSKYKVNIPDLEYYSSLVKCRSKCPVGTDSGGYVQAIAAGDYERAYMIARGPNPLASVCGWVCNAPCEALCTRGAIDGPVAIRALKKFVTAQHGVEAVSDPRSTLRYSKAEGVPNGYNVGDKVAIIGSGAAGLAAAHDLARLGYRVTIFEALPVIGGMFYLVPEYRLPRDIIRAEIEAILGLGIETITNVKVGRDISFEAIQKEYKAVIVAIGAWLSRPLPIDGMDLEGVHQGIPFLKKASFHENTGIGKKVIVIGGGNVAMDVARVAARLGDKEVHVVAVESLDKMPADKAEIEDGLDEGIIFHPSNGPRRVVGRDGKVAGLECIKVKSVFDSQGRFNPAYHEGTEWVLEGDTVIVAIGQMSDSSLLPEGKGFKVSRGGVISVDEKTMSTGVPAVFAVGDVAHGPGIFIQAIASGQKAARTIDCMLSGRRYSTQRSGIMNKVDHFRLYEDNSNIERYNPPLIPPESRKLNNKTVEGHYTEEEAKKQAERCLRCHINTVFNGDLCILCGGCVDVCPEYCLKMVPIAEITGDENLTRLFEKRYGYSLSDMNEAERAWHFNKGTAMIKDEDRCLKCGLCAKRCPTKAVSMERFEYKEEVKIV